MSVLKTFTIFLAAIGIGLAQRSPSDLFKGIWWVHRIISENENDVYKCVHAEVDVLNDTVVHVKVEFNLNGKAFVVETDDILEPMDTIDGRTFLYDEYKYDGTNHSLFCKKILKFSPSMRSATIHKKCDDCGFRYSCVSKDKDIPKDIEELCSTYKNYKEVDNSNC